MKDSIVKEIHRRRAAYAKRFNYDAHAIGEDIRRCEAKSGGVFVTLDGRAKTSEKIARQDFGGTQMSIRTANRVPASCFASISYPCWACRRRGVVLDGEGKIEQWLY